MKRAIRKWLKRHNPFAVWHWHATGLERPRVLGHRHPVYVTHDDALDVAHPEFVAEQ